SCSTCCMASQGETFMFTRSAFVWCGVVLAVWAAFAGPAAAEETVVYVSPEGNDAWSGALAEPNAQRTDGPVATPQKARDLVRAIRASQGANAAPVRVALRGGAYWLTEPLVLQPQDSGAPGAPVTWTASENEKPVVSGGQRITGWIKTTINDREAWT